MRQQRGRWRWSRTAPAFTRVNVFLVDDGANDSDFDGRDLTARRIYMLNEAGISIYITKQNRTHHMTV